MLHVIYRSYDGENNKERPAFYSKVVALASCIRAFEGLKAGTAEIIYFNDGPIPAERIRLMERSGEILACSRQYEGINAPRACNILSARLAC
jgi:hypothetical protein